MCDCYMVSESGKEIKYLGFRLITLELRSMEKSDDVNMAIVYILGSNKY